MTQSKRLRLPAMMAVLAVIATLTLTSSGTQAAATTCPDGTNSGETLICAASPPVGTNADANLGALLGDDDITINSGVTVQTVMGDGDIDGTVYALVNTIGDEDFITNNGTVSWRISGDGVGDADGGPDSITNNGTTTSLYGDEIEINSNARVFRGGDDLLQNTATVMEVMAGDLMIEGNNLIGITSGEGGNDTLFNSDFVDVLSGDALSLQNNTGGNDTITNAAGATTNVILGDDIVHFGDYGSYAVYGGADRIINAGTVTGDIRGDSLSVSEYVDNSTTPLRGGDDVIELRPGSVVQVDVYGDWVETGLEFSRTLTEDYGGDDWIIIAGTVEGTVYGEGGEDTIILNDGISGGADNTITIDGGQDALSDVLYLDLSGLTATQINTINAQAGPSSGNVTVGGLTINWVDFAFVYAVPAFVNCPDGDSGNDNLVCSVSPSSSAAGGDIIDGDLGNDTITLNNGVTVFGIAGDSIYGLANRANSGGVDTLTINGNVTAFIAGDYLQSGNGGDDTINLTNTAEMGPAVEIDGDYILGTELNGIYTGGNDTITFTAIIDTLNDGTWDDAVNITGDRILTNQTSGITANGGNDIITVDAGPLVQVAGDGLFADSVFGGGDTITINATVDNVYGDWIFPEVSALDNAAGGDDEIIINGTVVIDVWGDYMRGPSNEPVGVGGNDTITVNGTIDGKVEGEGGDDTIILQDNAASTDNLLQIYGGTHETEDVIDFAYTSLTGTEEAAIIAAAVDPAFGEVVINGLTIQFFDFETVLMNGMSIDAEPCPDGTDQDDTLVCIDDPPIGTNTDNFITGGAGEDDITVVENVIVGLIDGDGGLDGLAYPDTITNNGIASMGSIMGENVLQTNGAVDQITNGTTGSVYNIYGDYIETDDNNPVTAGADIITNDGTVLGLIMGDYVGETGAGNYGVSSLGTGGADTIVNNGVIGFGSARNADPIVSWELSSIIGDYGSITSGIDGANDNITNNGQTVAIVGDAVFGQHGDDIILNTSTGTVDHSIYGDWMQVSDTPDATPGADTITNRGTVGFDIYGDWIGTIDSDPGVEPVQFTLTGEGDNDTIINSGTVGGAIYGEGGDDTVRLQDGANGGDDNTLDLWGGNGFDTLDFDFTGLTTAEITAIVGADPANDSVTIAGQTFDFSEFEAIQINGGATEPCPDGTANPDTLVCLSAPPIGSNTNNLIEADAGNDTITVDAAVTITGDGGVYGGPGNDGITNDGSVGVLHGDGMTDGTPGGDDAIVNRVGATVIFMGGDTLINGDGGNDFVVNAGVVGTVDTPGVMGGDNLSFNSNTGTAPQAGDDEINVNGTLYGDLYGDYIYDTFTNTRVEVNGGNDRIAITGTVTGTVYGEAGDDEVGLQNGTSGGSDNTLVLDGGPGTDILNFAFDPLTSGEIAAINAADPANDSVTIGGQTFTFTNFETLQIGGVDVGSGAAVIRFNTESSSVDEDAGTTNITVALTITQTVTNTPITADLSYSGSGAAEVSGPSSVSFSETAVGPYSQAITLTITDNAIADGDRTVEITLSNPSTDASIGTPATHTLTIVDDEGGITLGDVPTELQPNATTLSTPPVTPTFTWLGVRDAVSYRLFLRNSARTAVINQVFAEDVICTDFQCSVDSSDLLPNWGLVVNNYEWWVGAIMPDNSVKWSGGEGFPPAIFTVDVPPAQLPDNIVVNPNRGRVTVSWTDDPNTLWIRLWVGGGGQTPFFQWIERGPDYTCDAGTCTYNPDWNPVAASSAGTQYSYGAWLYAWSPGGFSTGGPLPNAPGWNNSSTFTLPNVPASLPTAAQINIVTPQQAEPAFTWPADANTTWYQVYITPSVRPYTALFGGKWLNVEQLGCLTLAETTCTLDNLNLSGTLVSGQTYSLWLRAWGPGGGATNPANNTKWVESQFTYQP